MDRFVLMAHQNIELFHGWKYRIEWGQSTTNPQKHIHVFNEQKGVEYVQNEDGSPHDGYKNGPPPKKVREKLEEKRIWKWKFDSSNISDAMEVVSLSVYLFNALIIYANLTSFNDDWVEDRNVLGPEEIMIPKPVIYYLPIPIPSTFPVLEPILEVVPALAS